MFFYLTQFIPFRQNKAFLCLLSFEELNVWLKTIKICFWDSLTFANPSPNAKYAIVNNKWILGQKILLIQGSRFDFKDFIRPIFIWTSVQFDLFPSFDVQFYITFLIWFWINLKMGKTRIFWQLWKKNLGFQSNIFQKTW